MINYKKLFKTNKKLIKTMKTMKKLNFLLTGLLLTASVFLTQQANAQAPQYFSYQSVLRNSSNALLANTTVATKISILQENFPIFSEIHTGTTNANGLLSLQVGNGNLESGNFNTIDWAAGPYFIKTETDPTGGSNYTITGVQQLLSVPYALYAAKSGDGSFKASIANASDIVNTNSGNVGIGTDTPTEKLEVAGNLKTSGTLNGVNFGRGVGNNEWNIAIGSNALNAGGDNSLAIGLYSLANTSGVSNVALGLGAIGGAPGGSSSSYNTAVGVGANSNITSSLGGNTAMGYRSLDRTSSGIDNTGIGVISLFANTTGSNNTAVGSRADVANGELNNATAIGAGAVVDDSNKIQLGNSAITVVNTSGIFVGAGLKTSGSISLGTNSPDPSAKLEVNSTNQGFLPPRMTSAQRSTIESPAIGLVVFCTDCGPSSVGGELQVFSGGMWRNLAGGTAAAPAAVTLQVGDLYGGGKVAYLLNPTDSGYDANVQHGLIAALSDQSAASAWNNDPELVPPHPVQSFLGTSTGYGSGMANTNLIMADQGYSGPYAAVQCRQHNGGEFTDWYLPSIDELQILYTNRQLIGGFNSNWYWSSSEYTADPSYVYFYSFSYNFSTGALKEQLSAVRAVRTF